MYGLPRTIVIWSAAFAALPPLLLLLVDGHRHPGLPAGALVLSLLLTAAGLPLLRGSGDGAALYRRLEGLLRLSLLVLFVMLAVAGRPLA